MHKGNFIAQIDISNRLFENNDDNMQTNVYITDNTAKFPLKFRVEVKLSNMFPIFMKWPNKNPPLILTYLDRGKFPNMRYFKRAICTDREMCGSSMCHTCLFVFSRTGRYR